MKKDNITQITYLDNQERKLKMLIESSLSKKKEKKEEVFCVEESKTDYPEQYRTMVDNLNQKREELKEKMLVENEYTNSLMNMIKNEKTNIKITEDNYIDYEEKVKKINLSLKNIEVNLKENSKKNKNVVTVNFFLFSMNRILFRSSFACD